MLHLVLAALLTACGTASAPEQAPSDADPGSVTKAAPHVGLNIDDTSICASCHGQVVSEWNESMHARAHVGGDPLYAAMRTFRMGKEGEALGPKCDTCHTPRAAITGSTDAGVTCATCHTTLEVLPDAAGAKALVSAPEGVFVGPRTRTGTSHGTVQGSSALADGQTICLACHAATTTPQGLASCTTGPEHAELGSGASCTSCHMPRVPGPNGAVSNGRDHASHAFLGPHRAWYQDDPAFLGTAIGVTADWEASGLTLTVANQSGHAVPTGFPGRMAWLKVTAFDTAGQEVWSNATDDPMAQAPEAVWNKIYVDAEGKPTMPPYATELKADRRLQPGATVTLTYAPPPSATRVEARLVYLLIPPPAAKAIGIEGTLEASPRSALVGQFSR